jgi:GH24 family phage-related lysozyme (muramidase)
MNGRVYDPNLGRFLSVDPVFEFPTNTQSLNPYTYVLNNPLSMTDPTGYTASGCPPGNSTCPGDNSNKQYGSDSGESSRIAEGKRDAAEQKFDASVRKLGAVAKGLTGPLKEAVTKLYDSLVKNGAKVLQGMNDAQTKPVDSAGIDSPEQNSKTQSDARKPVHDLSLDQSGANFTIAREGGMISEPYRDSAKRWTIAVGHLMRIGELIPAGSDGQISEATGMKLFENDLKSAQDAVKEYIRVPLYQREYNALVDFAFNIGVRNFSQSTTVRLINMGQYSRGASAMALFNKITVKHQLIESHGLDRRRRYEIELFNGGHQ